MKKRKLTKYICLFWGMLFLLMPQTVGAEVPEEEEELISDTFYIEHKENCKTTDWTFMADKEVLRYKDPQTEKKLDKAICKGENVRIQRIYQTASEKWGLLFWSRDAKGNITNTTGWVKLSDLEFVYDTHAFYMDHKEELELVSDMENLSFEEIRNKLNQEVVLWSYPCSGEIVCRISAEKYPTDNRIQSGLVYQDDEKRYWLLIPSGTDSVGTKWSGYSICLSDPANEKISAKKIEPFTTPDSDETGNTKYIFCVVCMVCCMCVVGACAVIYRKRHKK